MEYLIAAIFILVLTLVFFFVKSRKKNTPPPSQRVKSKAAPQQPPIPSHLGVVLTAPDPAACCEPARELLSKVITADAPTVVPLPGCTHKDSCRCRLEKKYDTRSGKERRETEERRESIRFEDKPDRRGHVDRRKHQSMWNKDRH
ncbi:MAG: hypothetical protein ACU826_03710 [Gammaproteobacteria bacterium]